MVEVQEDGKKSKGGAAWIAAVVIGLLVLVAGAAGAFLLMDKGGAVKTLTESKAQGPLARHATGSLAKLETHARPREVPPIRFNDREGRPVDLSAFRGKVTVVNFWATWCAPCVVEMPTLAALQRRFPADKVAVVAISVDRPDDLPDAISFIDVHEPLALYHDPEFRAPFALGVRGLPATLILDEQGREVARLTGEARWDGPEAKALIDALLAD